MAASRSKQPPVGSAGYVLDERQYSAQCVDENVEEFRYAVRNEMEWLNEHMSGILNASSFNLTETFKTPGKLRGRTPRTARKRNPLEERAPLTDVFAPTPNARPSPATNTAFFKQVSKFRIAEDKENDVAQSPRPAQQPPTFSQSHVDSEYHDMTDEEPEIPVKSSARQLSPPKPIPQKSPLRSPVKPPQLARLQETSEVRSTQDTFISAAETPSSKPASFETANEETSDLPRRSLRRSSASTRLPAPMPSDLGSAPEVQEKEPTQPDERGMDWQRDAAPGAAEQQTVPAAEAAADAKEEVQETISASPTKSDTQETLSDTSSPDRPAVLRKKSSLTFASLPAREPLGTKKSMGARNSRTSHIDRSKLSHSVRISESKQRASQKLIRQEDVDHDESNQAVDEDEPMDDDEITTQTNTSEALQLHNKTSTQRLHERITMLGKMNSTRDSKSVPSAAVPARSVPVENEPMVAEQNTAKKDQEDHEEDDDWIGPMESVHPTPKAPPAQPAQPSHSSEGAEPAAPTPQPKHPAEGDLTLDQARSNTQYPDLSSHHAAGSTTPAGSPSRNHHENPLSASRSKLFSWARGIFAGSASTSAKAKQELLSPQAARSNGKVQQPASLTRSQTTHTVPLPQERPMNTAGPARRQEPPNEAPPSRRSSARVKAQRVSKAEPVEPSADIDMKDAHEGEIQEHHAHSEEVFSDDDELSKPQPPVPHESKPLQKPHVAATSMSKHGELRRPTSKQGQDTASKSRPAPVLVRTASQRAGRAAPTNAALGSSLHETLAQSTQSKSAPHLKNKASNPSIKASASTTSLKSSTAAGSRPKALEAAERKRAQDEREAQRKAEQRREMEKRRAAKAEEERRAAAEERERKATEQRELEARNAAQRQAAEQRRQEAIRRNEQMRQQNAAGQAERPESQQQANSSQSSFRPISRLGNNTEGARPAVPHINPAKPPKRYWQDDEESSTKRAPAAAKSGGASAAKRRRTSEAEAGEGASRPTMQPPMRMSTMKNALPNKFQQGFMSANGGGSSMLKTAVSTHHQQMQHPKTPHMQDMGKYSHARPPFAEAPNPPGTARAPNSTYKTPGTAQSKAAPSTVAKSSPNYPNGDNISLPEIATDSEESDEDDSFVPPDWANSPALRELLKDQQLVDPLKVFGPIAPLSMEEVFKGTSKERQAKFRKRTSSAQWSGPDRLTEEERRKDFEARQRLQAQGRWTFDTST